jgi:hypothetical protein
MGTFRVVYMIYDMYQYKTWIFIHMAFLHSGVNSLARPRDVFGTCVKHWVLIEQDTFIIQGHIFSGYGGNVIPVTAQFTPSKSWVNIRSAIDRIE